ncbi:MAG: TonB-dependent receptor [Flavobacteriales bacterium]|nr:TonB-dependent receptor [Flavobacteriales bacterium]
MPRPHRALAFLFLLLPFAASAQQYRLRGTITDAGTGETLIGASVVLKGTTTGSQTDVNGRFELLVSELPPYTLVISFVGYTPLEVQVKSLDQELKFKLSADQVLLDAAEVVGQRISEKQKQAPLTVETMDLIAIRNAPTGDFYQNLGNLKGVDMVVASFGFKVINTRGFNSTSPVRSLQLIDGVDNQSPGLNFSLGNFLGASDLDVMRVDVIAGASTAYFGPGAFNGVINMTTKSPWQFPGLSVSGKVGERNMVEGAVRWAQVLKGRDGRERWAYKLNLFALRALDWPVDNYDPTVNSPTGIGNPGRFDAVNIYGDENVAPNNNFTRSTIERRDYPGLGTFLRNGYRESELVDYDMYNLKAGGSLHYKLTDSVEVVAASNFSTGSTVYQGDNRYRLQDVRFFQHRLEVHQGDKWSLRGYVTHEDAGNTYDIFTTAVRMQEASGSTGDWNVRYSNVWFNWIRPQVNALPGYITVQQAINLGWSGDQWAQWQDQFIADNNATFSTFHQQVMDSVNRTDASFIDPFFAPGTDRFDSLFASVTSRLFTEGGSRFFDRSALAHAMGHYRFKPLVEQAPDLEMIVGGNFRQFLPNSAGTIFKDTGDVVIRNSEFGGFLGVEKPFLERRLKATATVRVDKNQNFDPLVSPAASLVYTPRQDRTFRVSMSSAIRNPTLADQYLYYNVGRAILLGNVNGDFEEGRDSLFTIESFIEYRNSPSLISGLSKLEYFNVDAIRPERAQTIELGYRGTHWDKFYLDLTYYHSWYQDFIGYIIGLYGRFDQSNGFPIGGIQAFRLAANASEQVRTQGFNLGLNYYRHRTTYNFNYSWNELLAGKDDPIIPAFNTPTNKFNVGVNAHDRKIPFTQRRHLGFGANYKFIQSFTFEGSPQFTGSIPTYDMVDAQVSVAFPAQHLTVKLGASNLFGLAPLFDRNVPDEERLERVFDNRVMMVFGGPRVGRLAYLQLVYELDRR